MLDDFGHGADQESRKAINEYLCCANDLQFMGIYNNQLMLRKTEA